MYLQSAEILNFHGIRHLKINFEPETSALIGENAWGKSSLLSALWLILGQGSEQLCTFSKNDLYIPIRLGADYPAENADVMGTLHSFKEPFVNQDASQDTRNSATSVTQNATCGSAQSAPQGGTQSDFQSVLKGACQSVPQDGSHEVAQSKHSNSSHSDTSYSEASHKDDSSLEQQAKNILSERFKHLSTEYLYELKPYKVITTRDYQRFYFAVPNAEHTGKILRIVDLPVEPMVQSKENASRKRSKSSAQMRISQPVSSKSLASKQYASKQNTSLKDEFKQDASNQSGDSKLYSFYNAALARFLANNTPTVALSKDALSGTNFSLSALSGSFLPQSGDSSHLNALSKATAGVNIKCSDRDSLLKLSNPRVEGNKSDEMQAHALGLTLVSASDSSLASGSDSGLTSALASDSASALAFSSRENSLHGIVEQGGDSAAGFKSGTLDKAVRGQSKEELFQAMRDAQKQEADFERKFETPLSATHLMMRARNLLDAPDGLDASERKFVQADYDFFANDIYQASADKIVIDLIFCENTYGTINNIERFAKIRKACFYGDDGLYRVHYRITGEFASNYAQHNSPDDISLGVKSGTVVYATSGSATSTQAYNRDDAPDDRRSVNQDAFAEREDNFVTVHELLDENGQPIADALSIIKDIITLNPLLRLRDRRMLKLSEMEDVVQNSKDATSANASSSFASAEDNNQNEDICKLRSLFVSISQDDDLTCEQFNQGLDELNVIASKYLVNYRSNYYIQNHPHDGKSRTARDIVSHPVSIETLNTLKQSLEDKRPSRSKFLLSLLAGAMLMNNGTQEIDTFSKPILVLEDIEGRFHPTLLLSLWSILDTIPIQKIVTTNSSALLSAMPMSNIRRLCRQYYDVRCYSVPSQAFNVDDERRLAFHIRISRPSAFFARCWILVEGETEVWMLNEIAGILGMNLSCEGVKTIEFAQCGLAPLIKLAKQLGISYYVLTDGDEAGRKYAQTVQSFTGTQHISDHLSVIPHVDIEHYFYVSGYADVYQKAAGLNISTKKPKLERQELSKLISQAQAQVLSQGNGITSSNNFTQFADAVNVGNRGKEGNIGNSVNSAQSVLNQGEWLGGIEIDPSPVQITLPQLLKFLQRWYGRHLALMNRLHSIELTQDERFNLQQALELGLDFLSTKSTQASKQGAASQAGAAVKTGSALEQEIQELTFDLSKVSVKEINQYYAQSELNLRKSGGLNRKLTNKQRQAIQRLHLEKAEVLYGLKLTNQKPQTKTLFKANNAGGKKRSKHKDNLREHFTLPSSLYNYLKRNFVKQQQSKIKQLQKHLDSGFKFKHSPELPSTIHDKEWRYLKSLIAKLQSLQHRQELKMQPPLTRNISHSLAQRFKLIKAETVEPVNDAAGSVKGAANYVKNAADAVNAVEQGAYKFASLSATASSAPKEIAEQPLDKQTVDHGPYKQAAVKAGDSHATKQPAVEAQALSTKQWAYKLAQEEQNHEDIFKSDLELASAHLDPLDEAKVLRKARQQAGIKYGSYGAIDQAVLNKQGWTIDKIIDSAIHKKSKPGLAIMVVEAMQQRGAESVPQMFRTMFMKIKRIAKSEFGI